MDYLAEIWCRKRFPPMRHALVAGAHPGIAVPVAPPDAAGSGSVGIIRTVAVIAVRITVIIRRDQRTADERAGDETARPPAPAAAAPAAATPTTAAPARVRRARRCDSGRREA